MLKDNAKMGLADIRFQQDADTCHRAHGTMDLMKNEFGELLISRFGSAFWPRDHATKEFSLDVHEISCPISQQICKSGSQH